MDHYFDHVREHLRITLLRLLSEMPGYRTNASLMTDAATSMGLPANRDRVHTELAWLAEQGLVRTEALNDRLTVATLTERGLDVALGRAAVPGVKRPGP